MANSPSVCVRVSQSCRLVNVLKNGSTSSITKASPPTIMQVAFSSVNLGSNVNPSLVKKSTERFRSRTGRFTNILRDGVVDTVYLLRGFVLWTVHGARIHRSAPKRREIARLGGRSG